MRKLRSAWERECASYLQRRKAKQAEQIMAPLPINHLKPSLRAFVRTAVDFAGPCKGEESLDENVTYVCLHV